MSLITNNQDPGIFEITHRPIESFNGHSKENTLCKELANQIYHFAKSKFQEMCYNFSTLFCTTKEYLIGASTEYVVPSADKNDWKKDSKGLYVAIHGVNGRPNIWRKQFATLQKQQQTFDIRLPYVPKKGNCSLEEATTPIEAMIRDYISKNPSKPICLLGVSNGARIAAELEIRLRNTKSPIKVSTIAGALAGTTKMDLMDNLGVAKKVYAPSFCDELRYQSQTATQLIKRMQEPLEEAIERSYDFYASPNDFQINPYTGTYPNLDSKDAHYFFVPGENHNSLVSRVSSFQIQRCIDWMERA